MNIDNILFNFMLDGINWRKKIINDMSYYKTPFYHLHTDKLEFLTSPAWLSCVEEKMMSKILDGGGSIGFSVRKECEEGDTDYCCMYSYHNIVNGKPPKVLAHKHGTTLHKARYSCIYKITTDLLSQEQ